MSREYWPRATLESGRRIVCSRAMPSIKSAINMLCVIEKRYAEKIKEARIAIWEYGIHKRDWKFEKINGYWWFMGAEKGNEEDALHGGQGQEEDRGTEERPWEMETAGY